MKEEYEHKQRLGICMSRTGNKTKMKKFPNIDYVLSMVAKADELPGGEPPLEQIDTPFDYNGCIAGCDWEFEGGVGWFRRWFQFNLGLHMKHCKKLCRCSWCGDDEACREKYSCEFWENYTVPST